MINRYTIQGMTCGGCAATVQRLLSGVAGVTNVQIDLHHHEASIGTSHTLPISALQAALAETHYRITELTPESAVHAS
jgi:copper chaperone CopZ